MLLALRNATSPDARRRRVVQTAVPLALLLLPLLANWQAVSGWLQHDPIYVASGLARDAVAGPLQGFVSQDPNDGWTTEALGHLAAEQWLSGRVPWWNPFGGIGLPLAAEMQCSALFLPFVLLLHFPQGPLLLKVAMQVIAGLATWGLLRVLGLGRLPAFTGAALFELNGTFAWFGDAPMLPVAFLPLLLLGLEGARRAALAGVRGGWVWVPLALAWSLYAGFPETAYIDGLLALGWAMLRFGQMRGEARAAFAAKVAFGGTAGLLLATPVLLPFEQLMRYGDVGAIHVFTAATLPPNALAALLSPYVIGIHPLSALFEAADPHSWVSNRLGGYLSLPMLLLALLGVAGRGRERGLRWLLVAWCVLALGRTAGAPGVSQLVNAVPLIQRTMFFRYAPPSWELAAVVLGAFALEDWQRRLVNRRAVLLAAGIVFVAGSAALVAALPLIRSLMRPGVLEAAPDYPWWLWGSLLWTGGITVAAALLLSAPGPRRRAALGRAALAGLLVVDALALFTIPALSAPRGALLDRGALSFLSQNLGLLRFHTEGPLRPNYGAYFRLASINAFYLPLPRAWADHIKRALDPDALPVLFGGGTYSPYSGSVAPVPGAALRARVAAYEALAVRYVLTWHGANPFIEVTLSDVADAGNQAVPLAAGQDFEGTFPPRLVSAGRLASFGVQVGTYGGAANGHLRVELCTDQVCTAGAVDLAGAADNGMLAVPLDAPLDVAPGAPIRYRITHTDGGVAVALWLWPERDASSGAPLAPRIALTYVGPSPAPPRVYADDLVDIYELPHPEPYFETLGDDCTITPSGRDKLAAECRAPALLVRRELAYPGWHATVNGAAVPVEEVAPLFQAIRLPAGISRGQFRYWTPHIGRAYAAALHGLAGVAAGCWPGRRPSAKRRAW